MSQLLSLCAEAIVEPVAAVRRATSRESDGALALLFTGAVLVETLSGGVADASFPLGISSALAVGLLAALLALLGGGALIHMAARLFGGQGDAADLLRAACLAVSPALLLPPFALAGGGIYSTARIAVFMWQVALLVIAIRECHRLSTGVAAISLITPLLVLLTTAPLLLFAAAAATLLSLGG